MQLFDAIEISFEQNGIFGVIEDLYQGVNKDYIKCLKCNYESPREAKFFDLRLIVKDAFSTL